MLCKLIGFLDGKRLSASFTTQNMMISGHVQASMIIKITNYFHGSYDITDLYNYTKDLYDDVTGFMMI